MHRAALALARAVMREAGLQPADLVEARPRAQRAEPPKRAPAPPAPIKPKAKRREPGLPGAQLVAPPPAAATAPVVVVAPQPMQGEAVIPAHVKVTRCPSPRDTRFTVDGPLVGEFTKEWQAKRGGRHGA